MLRVEDDTGLSAALDNIAREPRQWGGRMTKALEVFERTAEKFIAAVP